MTCIRAPVSRGRLRQGTSRGGRGFAPALCRRGGAACRLWPSGTPCAHHEDTPQHRPSAGRILRGLSSSPVHLTPLSQPPHKALVPITYQPEWVDKVPRDRADANYKSKATLDLQGMQHQQLTLSQSYDEAGRPPVEGAAGLRTRCCCCRATASTARSASPCSCACRAASLLVCRSSRVPPWAGLPRACCLFWRRA